MSNKGYRFLLQTEIAQSEGHFGTRMHEFQAMEVGLPAQTFKKNHLRSAVSPYSRNLGSSVGGRAREVMRFLDATSHNPKPVIQLDEVDFRATIAVDCL